MITSVLMAKSTTAVMTIATASLALPRAYKSGTGVRVTGPMRSRGPELGVSGGLGRPGH